MRRSSEVSSLANSYSTLCGVLCSGPVLWYAIVIASSSRRLLSSPPPLLSPSSNLLSSSSLILLLLSSPPLLWFMVLFAQQVLYGQRGGRNARESGLPHLPVLQPYPSPAAPPAAPPRPAAAPAGDIVPLGTRYDEDAKEADGTGRTVSAISPYSYTYSPPPPPTFFGF